MRRKREIPIVTVRKGRAHHWYERIIAPKATTKSGHTREITLLLLLLLLLVMIIVVIIFIITPF